MKRYRVLKSRFIYGRSYGNGDVFEAEPNSLLRRAVRDGDLELAEDRGASTPASNSAPKRKPKRSDNA